MKKTCEEAGLDREIRADTALDLNTSLLCLANQGTVVPSSLRLAGSETLEDKKIIVLEPSQMDVFLRRFCTALVLPVFLALGACAVSLTGGEIAHGLSVANKGDTKISNVIIEYGKITRNECVPFCWPRSGGGVWNSPMPIPETMRVTWLTEDGHQHDVNVPVRTRLKDKHRLRTLYLEFSSEKLVVIQGLYGLADFPLFP